VKIIYENDVAKGPGNGIFHLSAAKILLPQEYLRFTVRRSSDQQCLAAGGWQDAETLLAPREIQFQVETAALFVGSDVVDQLDHLETYRLSLVAPDGSRDAGILTLEGVIYSSMTGGGGLKGYNEKPATPPPPPPPPPPVDKDPAAVVPPLVEPLEPLPPTPPRRWPLAAALGAALLLAAGAAWYFLARQPEPPTTTWAVAESTGAPAATTPVPELAAKPEEQPAAKPAAPEAAQPPVAPAAAPAEPELTPRQRVQAFLRDKGSPQAALELSRTMPESPDGRDAAFILQEVAAEGGLGQAMLVLARVYDPTDAAPAGTIKKDPEQAWIWYAKAAAAGETEATPRIDGLKTWLTQEADKGSAQARQLLARMR